MATFRDFGCLWPTFLHGGKDEHEARQHKLIAFLNQVTRNWDDLLKYASLSRSVSVHFLQTEPEQQEWASLCSQRVENLI